MGFFADVIADARRRRPSDSGRSLSDVPATTQWPARLRDDAAPPARIETDGGGEAPSAQPDGLSADGDAGRWIDGAPAASSTGTEHGATSASGGFEPGYLLTPSPHEEGERSTTSSFERSPVPGMSNPDAVDQPVLAPHHDSQGRRAPGQTLGIPRGRDTTTGDGWRTLAPEWSSGSSPTLDGDARRRSLPSLDATPDLPGLEPETHPGDDQEATALTNGNTQRARAKGPGPAHSTSGDLTVRDYGPADSAIESTTSISPLPLGAREIRRSPSESPRHPAGSPEPDSALGPGRTQARRPQPPTGAAGANTEHSAAAGYFAELAHESTPHGSRHPDTPTVESPVASLSSAKGSQPGLRAGTVPQDRGLPVSTTSKSRGPEPPAPRPAAEPQVQIGRIDVIVEAPASPQENRRRPQQTVPDFSSRLYLRGL